MPTGGASHAAALARPDPALPRIIRLALTGDGAWERLRRFQAAMRYPTLGKAADALGLEQTALTSQFSRLERDIGAELYTRAVRGRPMSLTRRGRALLTVLDSLASPVAGAEADELPSSG
jgi:DNA-binding transcriptional LysR family regulator